VRVNAQLIDAESGAHLWADRFEEDVADLFKLQDQVVARLASALGYELVAAEAKKGSRSAKPDATDLSMRGWTMIWRAFSQPMAERREINKEARALFDRALQIDPDDADALAGSAYTYYGDYLYKWGDPGTDYEAKLLGQADRAIVLAPDNVRAYYVKAAYLSDTGRSSEAVGVADAGLAVNPNFVPLYNARARAELFLGRSDTAKADAERAMRLSPRDPYVGPFHLTVGDSEINLRHFDAAIDEYRKAIDSGFRTPVVYANLAAAYAQAGKIDDAKAALREALRLQPKLAIKLWPQGYFPVVLEGLRKAGLPEE
jgi:tetratricopeptide (TPR) repeat protein